MTAPAGSEPDPRRWICGAAGWQSNVVVEFINPLTRSRVRLSHPMASSVFVEKWPQIIQTLKTAWIDRHEDPRVLEVTP